MTILTVCLLCVGVESHTPLRHVTQCVPAALAALLGFRRVPGAAAAGAGVAIVWIAVVLSIWAFLLGLPHLPFTRGHFTLIEIVLTIGMLGSGAFALVAAARERGVPPLAAAGWFATFGLAAAAALRATIGTPLGRM